MAALGGVELAKSHEEVGGKERGLGGEVAEAGVGVGEKGETVGEKGPGHGKAVLLRAARLLLGHP